MEYFEFVIRGPAVALRAAKKNAPRYRRWVNEVARVAQENWPPDAEQYQAPIEVVITNFYTEEAPDVDNIVKPILDGTKGIAFVDDVEVYRVVSQKVSTLDERATAGAPEVAKRAFGTWSDVVLVGVAEIGGEIRW
jgi:Holliday junction resolvase RusA-like endonuclease